MASQVRSAHRFLHSSNNNEPTYRKKMIDKLIEFALSQRAATLMLIVAVVALGIYSVSTIATDSFPDVSNVQVQIITEPESMATEEVESLVTVPIEYALNGLPFVKKVRSSSEFGLSVVTAIFDDSCDVYFARQLVQQRLQSMSFPPEVPRPQLGPVISSFSQVLMYNVTSDHHDLIELRTIQDWNIAKRLLSVQGVGNVVSYGGWIKQYQVLVNQYRLRAYGLTVRDVLTAIEQGNMNAGGNFIETGDEEVIIRGVGRIDDVSDIANIVLKENQGTPVLVSSVATVQIGPAFRRGSASMNGKGETIIGIVMSRRGANTKDLVQRVEERLVEIQKDLPKGVKVTPFYNQKVLVDQTTDTVKEILMLSGGLVIVILTAVLLNISVSLIVAVIIPLSLLFSFVMMKFTGLSANLMTLGAVDFGVVVDAGVVMAENIFRRLSHAHSESSGSSRVNAESIILSAAKEVGRPIAFSIFIIISVYLPLFSLEGVEGKMFQPLALTFIYALLGALGAALFIVPLLCFWVLRGRVAEKHHPVLEFVTHHYSSMLSKLLKVPKFVIGICMILLVASFAVVPLLGSEFMPSLDEGSIWLRLRMPPSISHTRTSQIVTAVEREMTEFPEVTIVVSRIGRSGMGSDVEGVDAGDIYIGLKPKSQWRNRNKEALVEQMAHSCSQFPGMMYSFSQPIADMIDDLITGVKADVGIKIFGEDLQTISNLADQIAASVKKVQGTGDVTREPVLGAPQLRVALKRKELARYGLRVEEVQDLVETALAGKVVSEVIEGSRRFGILVRFPQEQRKSERHIRQMMIDAPNGAELPLSALSDIVLTKGALLVNREDGQRRSAVMVNIRGRDLGSWVKAAQEQVSKDVECPPGYRIMWGGQFENQQRAMARLSIVVPIVLFVIFVLLFLTFGSFSNAGLIMLNVPFACIGGIFALLITHQPISVPAIIGFIALFGVAVQNGVILISYIKQLEVSGCPINEAVTQGARVRLRPVLTTALVAIMGLLPKLMIDGTGAEIQRPLATVVFGGLLTATIMTMLVLPVVYRLLSKRRKKTGVTILKDAQNGGV